MTASSTFVSSSHVSKCVTSANLVRFLEWALEQARCATEHHSVSTTHLSLPELAVEVISANSDYQQNVAEGLFSTGSTTRENGITVAIVSPDDSDMPPTPTWGEPVYHPRNVEKLLAETPFRATYFRDDHLWQIYNYQERFGVQWMRSPTAYPPWDAGAPLRVFLHWAYRFLGKRLVHAGTLGCQGRGILLVGKGGSGKSGTVLSGIAHGLDSVGDDYVLVEMGTEGPSARPLFQTLKQDLNGLQRLGLESSFTKDRAPNWQGKYELRLEEFGRTLTDQLQVGAIVLPRITRAPKSGWKPLARSRAMLALAPSGLMQMPGESESGVAFFSSLIRNTPCYQLELGMYPEEINEVIREFIARVYSCN